MKFERIGSAAFLGLAATAGIVEAREVSAHEKALQGTWNLARTVEAGSDVSDGRKGDLWVFEANGAFRRVSPGGASQQEQQGRWHLQNDGRELQLTLHARSVNDDSVRVERYPVVALEGGSLELRSPTQISDGVVIRQERTTSFFHS